MKKSNSIAEDVEGLKVNYSAAKSKVMKLTGSGKVFADDKRRNKVFSFIDLPDLVRG